MKNCENGKHYVDIGLIGLMVTSGSVNKPGVPDFTRTLHADAVILCQCQNEMMVKLMSDCSKMNHLLHPNGFDNPPCRLPGCMLHDFEPTPLVRSCVTCEKEFKPVNPDAIYCSGGCFDAQPHKAHGSLPVSSLQKDGTFTIPVGEAVMTPNDLVRPMVNALNRLHPEPTMTQALKKMGDDYERIVKTPVEKTEHEKQLDFFTKDCREKRK